MAAAGLLVLTVMAVVIGARTFSGTKSAAAPPPNSIAVLPFLSLDAGDAEERVTDGFAEELTNRLARFPELRVVARRSAFQFKGKPYDVRGIAGQLRVGTVLEGSLRRSGERVEITAELVSTADGYHLWADHFETEPKGIYGIEDEILLGVLRSLKITPRGGLEEVLHHPAPPPPEAHRLYLEARFFWNQRTYEALRHAISLYEEALKIDANYAAAWAGLAECYGVIAANGLDDTQSAATKGKDAAERAIAIDESVADAHAALGLIRSVADWDWPGAETSFQRAIALNPNDASAWQWRAHNLLWQGRFAEARQSIEKALDLDSLSLVILSNQAEFAYYEHHYQEALRLYDHTLSVDPSFISATIERGMTLLQLGKQQQALASFERARILTQEEASPLVGLAEADGRLGNRAEALRILRQLQSGAGGLHVSDFQVATIYASLGDVDAGIAALEEAYRRHEGFLIALKVHPDLDPLRHDPRFQELQERMHLE